MSEIRKAGERAIKELREGNRSPTSLEPRVEVLELTVAQIIAEIAISQITAEIPASKLKAETKALEDAIEELQEWQLDNRKAK